MKAAHWRIITAFAEAQYGLVTAAQLRMSGATPSEIARAIADGRLIRVRHRVVAVAGLPADPSRAARSVCLVTPDAVVSHRTAAWCFSLLRTAPDKVDVTVRTGRSLELVGVTAHECRLLPDERTVHLGIPITSPARTLVDLASVLSPDWVERLMHDAVMRRLCEYAQVHEVADRAAKKGIIGAAAVRQLVEGATGTTPLEALWARILRDAGLPEPVGQFQVVAEGTVFVLDFAWPEQRVALEADGFVAHRTRTAFDRDHDKVLLLKRAGWEVHSVTARTDPAPVIALLRQTLSGIHRDSPCGFPGDG